MKDRSLSRFRLGQALSLLGENRKALKQLRSAIVGFEKSGLDDVALKCRAEIGGIYRRLGRIDEAEEELRLCLNAKSLSKANAAGLRLNLANVLVDQGSYKDALSFFTESMNSFLDAGETRGAAAAATGAGAVRLALGVHREAIASFRDACARLGRAGNKLEAARALENLAMARAEAERPRDPGAIVSELADAAGVYRAEAASGDLVRVHANMANLFRQAGDFASARKKALEASCLITSAVSNLDRARAEIEMAASDLGEHILAHGAGEAALVLKETASRLKRIAVLVGKSGPLSLRIEGALLKAELLYCSKRRGGALAALKNVMGLLNSEQLSDIRMTMAWMSGEREEAYSRAVRLALRLHLPEIGNTLIRNAKERDLPVRVLTGKPRRKKSGREIVADLFLNYLITPGRLYVFVKTRSTRAIYEAPAWRIRELLDQFDEEISLAENVPLHLLETEARLTEVRAITHRLWDELLGPAEAEIDSVLSARADGQRPTMIVAPVGPLSRLPFGELTRGGRCLDEDFEVVSAVCMRRRGAPSNPTPKAPPRFRRAVVIVGNIDGLTGVDSEIRSVSRFLKAKVIRGRNLDSSTFLRKFEESDLLYYIGHAVSKHHCPLLSYLDLGKEKLFAREIMGGSAKSGGASRRPVVILSACSAAHEVGGMGLASSFLAAGASEVIASLWRVPDGLAAVTAVTALKRLIDPEKNRAVSIGNRHPFLRSPFVRFVSI